MSDKATCTQKTFTTIDGNTLMTQFYEPLGFTIESILPHGIFILAGSGKIGKSWLSLDMGIAVATGNHLWDFTPVEAPRCARGEK